MNGILKPKPKPKQKPEPKPKTNRKQTVGTPYFISLLYNMAANPPLTSLVNDAVEDDSNSEMDYDSDATIPLSTTKYIDIYRSRMKNKNIDTNSEDEDEEDLDKVVSNGVMNEGMQIIVSDLQTARENLEQMKHGLSVDLSGLIEPPPNVECYIIQSDYKDQANLIRPKTKRVLLSIKNFPDDYSSLEKVNEIVECIAIVVRNMVRNMNDNTSQIYINCRSGINRKVRVSIIYDKNSCVQYKVSTTWLFEFDLTLVCLY